MPFYFKPINAVTRLAYLPCPRRINTWWTLGSLLGLCLVTQLVRGLLLRFYYISEPIISFDLILSFSQSINRGWIFRSLHANGGSIFFICLYLHIGRGVYQQSFQFYGVWLIGVIIFLILIITAFLGYVLPWGQISFWGATVITRLLTAIPYIGGDVVFWIWGSFSVRGPTLTRFFALHFILPFISAVFIIFHLLLLHHKGSSLPLGLHVKTTSIPMVPYFLLKDLVWFIFLILCLFGVSLWFPWTLGDPENFHPANPLVAPNHIQPEWYFLFAYAILRCVPNKLGGVLALVFSILILLILPLAIIHLNISNGARFQPLFQIYFWGLVNRVLLLTWLGACPVEPPYTEITQILSYFYFFYFLRIPRLGFIGAKIS